MGNMKENNERKLIEYLYGQEQGQNVYNDIINGEQILRDNPAPEPSEELISKIKAQCITAHKARISTRFSLMQRVAVAAAVVIIAVLASLPPRPHTEPPKDIPIMSASLWDSIDVISDIPELALLSTEVKQLEEQFQAVQTGENLYALEETEQTETQINEYYDDNNNNEETGSIDTKISEIYADFLKG